MIGEKDKRRESKRLCEGNIISLYFYQNFSSLESRLNRIVILGAGRLANRLGIVFVRKGLEVIQVYDRTPGRGLALARKLGCAYAGHLQAIDTSADLYLVAVSDSAIATVAGGFKVPGKLVVHTSGTMGMEVLAPATENYGVFYPVQTFPAGRRGSLAGTPVCIEAAWSQSEELLAGLARQLSLNGVSLNGEKRGILHLAAVFASNYTHFMYVIAEDILREQGIPFSLLRPLIESTARNATGEHLIELQTGPAVRGDAEVLGRHRALLTAHPGYREMYDLITENIIQFKTRNG